MKWIWLMLRLALPVWGGMLRNGDESDPFCKCEGATQQRYNVTCENLQSHSSRAMLRDLLGRCRYTHNGATGEVTFLDSDVHGLSDDLFSDNPVLAFTCVRCSITDFPPDLFRSFGPSTERILLDNCTVDSIIPEETSALLFRENLRNLTISYGRLPTLPPKAFSGFANEDLSLHLESIQDLAMDDFAFADISNVSRIALRNNGNLQVPLHAFWNLTSLRILSLENNGIKSLKNGTFSNLTGLSTLHLGSNPWICDCDLEWLNDFMKENPQLDFGKEPDCSERGVHFKSGNFCLKSVAVPHDFNFDVKRSIEDLRLMLFGISCGLCVLLACTLLGRFEFKDFAKSAVVYLILLIVYLLFFSETSNKRRSIFAY